MRPFIRTNIFAAPSHHALQWDFTGLRFRHPTGVMGLSLEIPLAVAGLSNTNPLDGSGHYWPNM
jgi:hypothetical protein